MSLEREINAETVADLFAEGLYQKQVAERLGFEEGQFANKINKSKTLLEARQTGINKAQVKTNQVNKYKTSKVVYLDGEYPTLYDRQDFKDYCDLVENALNSRFQTIGDMHRKLGDKTRREWTLDALDSLLSSIETKGVCPTYYRLKS